MTQTQNEHHDPAAVAFDRRDQWCAEIVKAKLLTAAKVATAIFAFLCVIALGIGCLVLLFRSPDLADARWGHAISCIAAVWGVLFLTCSLTIIPTRSYRFGSAFFSVSDLRTETQPMTEIEFLTVTPIRRGPVAKVTAYRRYDLAWFHFLVVNDDVAKSKFAAMEKLGYQFKSDSDD